jgi:putative FmdB family regulatory protein
MPFYEYQCKNCGHDLEAMQKVSDPPLKKCPDCGKSQLQRLMSAPVFRLKGSGWYETDFKGDKDNQRNLADRPEAEAPKDAAKEAASGADGKGKDANGKDANGKDAKGADGNGKDAKGADGAGGKDAKGADGAGAKDTTAKDGAADKRAEKAPAESAKKVASSGSGKSSSRGRTAPRHKSPARRPIKKAAPKAKRRR